MLYFIGLGLSSERDITVAGLEVVKRASRVFLEAYTSILMVPQSQLEAFYGRPIELADRTLVESSSDTILQSALTTDIAFLVVGDPFGATTHTDLLLRARELGIPSRTIHNASIMNAIGATGLQLYSFGQTVSVPYFEGSVVPTSWYKKIAKNAELGWHTLVLLDIKVKEQSNLGQRGPPQYYPPMFMSVAECCRQMRTVEGVVGEGVCADEVLIVGVARVGSEDQVIKVGTLAEMCDVELGKPLHSAVMVGRELHDLERDFLRAFAVNETTFDEAVKKGGYEPRTMEERDWAKNRAAEDLQQDEE